MLGYGGGVGPGGLVPGGVGPGGYGTGPGVGGGFGTGGLGAGEWTFFLFWLQIKSDLQYLNIDWLSYIKIRKKDKK